MKECFILAVCMIATVYCAIHHQHHGRHLKRRLVQMKTPLHHHRHGHDVHPVENGQIWAVLVAGSNGWYNYRHQADVAHAFHTLLDHGVRKKNIITMIYDDIAHNKQNPYPGKIFNVPHGKNVYENLIVDYSKQSVTPENFLNILKGNKSGVVGGNGRVLESGPTDRVFVYFTDHGGYGSVSFPDEILTVKSLNEVLQWMYHKDRYNQLTFYLEACESGSMFENVLKKNINVYAVTAANSHESSYGTFCDNDMNLPCLGDEFSVNWMVDSDEEDLNTETLETQYEIVRKDTNHSHVMQFGDMEITKEPVAFFQGTQTATGRNGYSDKPVYGVSWPSRDVELRHLMRMRDNVEDVYERKTYSRRIRDIQEIRKSVKSLFHSVVDALVNDAVDRKMIFEQRRPITQLDCHHDVVHAFDQICIDFNQFDYAMKYVYVLSNLCERIRDANTIIGKLIETCPDAFFIL